MKGGRVSFSKESIGCQWDREPPVQRHSTKESPVFQGIGGLNAIGEAEDVIRDLRGAEGWHLVRRAAPFRALGAMEGSDEAWSRSALAVVTPP